jgi:Ca2+-binding RTX toxin-like protein
MANLSGDNASFATFATTLDFGTTGGVAHTIANGVTVSSGDATPALTNTSSGYSTLANGLNGNIMGRAAQDISYLSFNFTVPAGSEAVAFKWMFGTEEYNEYGGQYTDITAVWIDGVNYLTFPDGREVEFLKATGAGSNVDPGTGAFFTDNTGGALNVEYDGLTPPDVLVGLLNTSITTHTMQIAVADTGDASVDSLLGLQPLGILDAQDNGGGNGNGYLSSYYLGTANTDTLNGAGGGGASEQFFGLAGDDVLNGVDQSDKLYGGDGDDTLFGGAGADLLVGGAGADIFKYNSIGDGATTTAASDMILDFSSAQGDKIQFRTTGFGGINSLTNNTNYVEIAFSGDNLGELKAAIADGTIDGLADDNVADNTDYIAFLTFTDNNTSDGNSSANFLLYDDDNVGDNGLTVLADMNLTTASDITTTDFTFV